MALPLLKRRGRDAGAGAGDQTHAPDTLPTQVPLTDQQVRAVWLAASWLISYPDDTILARTDQLAALVAGLPAGVGSGMQETVGVLRGDDVDEVRAEYVETFDTRRRGCLYLTYFADGDTRRRGAALLAIKQTYRAAGLEVSEAELPDHLAYVLEFGAAYDMQAAVGVLTTHRAGLEVLRLHLADIGSPWHGPVEAVCLTLPPLGGDDVEAVRRLIAQGPVDEQVGLSDGAEDMPPMDLSPYALDSSGSGGAPGGPTFIPLSAVKGLRS